MTYMSPLEAYYCAIFLGEAKNFVGNMWRYAVFFVILQPNSN